MNAKRKNLVYKTSVNCLLHSYSWHELDFAFVFIENKGTKSPVWYEDVQTERGCMLSKVLTKKYDCIFKIVPM